MKPEDRVLAFIAALIELIGENIWLIAFIFWSFSGIINLFGNTEPKATINEPTKIEQKANNDGPKPDL